MGLTPLTSIFHGSGIFCLIASAPHCWYQAHPRIMSGMPFRERRDIFSYFLPFRQYFCQFFIILIHFLDRSLSFCLRNSIISGGISKYLWNSSLFKKPQRSFVPAKPLELLVGADSASVWSLSSGATRTDWSSCISSVVDDDIIGFNDVVISYQKFTWFIRSRRLPFREVIGCK